MSFVVAVTERGADEEMKKAMQRMPVNGVIMRIVEKRASFEPSFFCR